jgi:SAM-dependent methyltransferase
MTHCTICKNTNITFYCFLEPKHEIYKCKACKNAFTFPEPDQVAYEDDDFHGQFSFSSAESLPRQWRKAIKKQVSLVQRYFSKGASILEIGCGQGLLLQEIKNKGYNTFGIEPSKQAFGIAKNKGLNVLNGYFPQVNFSEDFDLIIMSQVLEHIKDPLAFLKSLSLAYKGKHLLLIQSNYKGIVPLKNKANWYAWVPDQHYSHFSPKGLKKITELSGIQLVTIEYSSLEYNNYWLSLISEVTPGTGDQLHCLIKL